MVAGAGEALVPREPLADDRLGRAAASRTRWHINRESRLMTDRSRLYIEVGGEFAGHETVCHSAEEYVRGEAHTKI